MNKTEKLAYDWLKSRGYRDVIYQKRGPTFLTDEKGFEVKRAYPLKAGGIKIIFQVGERERLIKQGYSVLVFSEAKQEPIDILAPEELKQKTLRGIIFHEYGSSKGSTKIRVSFKIDQELSQSIDILKNHFQLADKSAFLEMLLRRGYEEVVKDLRLSRGRDISVIR